MEKFHNRRDFPSNIDVEQGFSGSIEPFEEKNLELISKIVL